VRFLLRRTSIRTFCQRILILTVPLRRASITFFCLLSIVAPTSFAAAQNHFSPTPESNLKQHYDAAQHFQQLGELGKSAHEYREFIAEALDQLASGYAHTSNYDQAAPLFDEALALTPDEPGLLLRYAQAALAHADFQRAQSLAERVLKNNSSGTPPVDKQTAALAHQILGRALMKTYQDKEARAELEKAVALDPNFQNGYALAVVCLDMGDDKCANQIFSEMQSSFGDTALIHLEFGLAYGESDFPVQAIAEFKKAIAENPRLPEAHYSLAAAYLSSSEASSQQKAEVELKKELEISPDNFLAYAALGHIEAIQRQYADAERDLKHAIALNPDNPDAYLYLGQMYFQMDRSADAETALREAIQHTTDVSRNHYQIQKAHYLLGRLLAKSGRDAEAQAEMQIVQQLMSRSLARDKDRLSGMAPAQTAASGANSSTVAMATVDTDKSTANAGDEHAVEAFRQQIVSPVADSYNNLGAIAASGKDYTTALACFQHASEWNPNLEGLDYNWGRAAFMASQFKDAVPPLTRYLEAHPEDSGIRSPLAISLFMTKDYSGVVETLQPVLSSIDAVPQVEYVYAESLVQTGQRAAGVERLAALEKTDPGIPDVHRALGEAYADGNTPDMQKAASELAAAVRLNPLDAQAHYDLGRLDLQKGDVQAAIIELQTAVHLKPDDLEAHSALAAAYKQASRPDDAQREEKLYEQLQTSQHASPK